LGELKVNDLPNNAKLDFWLCGCTDLSDMKIRLENLTHAYFLLVTIQISWET